MNLFLLIFFFAFKHILADVVFQTDPQAQGKGKAEGWVFPLLCHAGTHGIFTALVMTAWTRSVPLGLVCGIFDTTGHFIIDRIKSSPNMFGKYKTTDEYFLPLLIADQSAHAACYLVIVFFHENWMCKLNCLLAQF